MEVLFLLPTIIISLALEGVSRIQFFSCSNPNFGVDSSQLHSYHLTPYTTEYLSLANSNYVVSSNISVNSKSLWKLCELPSSVNDD
jgi:hypothetical protein